MRVDEKWKRNGDFSSTFVLKKANRLKADAACRAIVVFDGCSGPFCYAISGRNAIERVQKAFQAATNEVTA